MAPGHHGVAPDDPSCRDRCTEPLVRDVALGDDEEPGRLLVQPMNQPRSFGPAALGELAAAAHEGVHQRPRPVARSRMDDHAGCLVHHEKVAVLVDDPERDVLALDVAARRCRLRLGDRDQIIGGRPVRGSLADAIDRDVPICDECRRRCPGLAQPGCNQQIQPRARRLASGEGIRRRRPPRS